jgi:hypothetical protein
MTGEESPWGADTVTLRGGADKDATDEQAERLRHVQSRHKVQVPSPRSIALGALVLVLVAGIAILRDGPGGGEVPPVAKSQAHSAASPTPTATVDRGTPRRDEWQPGRDKAHTPSAPQHLRVPHQPQSTAITPTAATAMSVVESPRATPSEPAFQSPVEPSTQPAGEPSTKPSSQVEREFGIER